MINELQVQCFLSVVRNKSFTDAARKRYTTQPSISKQIRKLEEEVGVPLFIRTARRPELTENGKKFYDFFSESEVRFQALKQEALESIASEEHNLRIAYLQATNFLRELGPVFDAFQQEYENFNIQISTYSFGDLRRALEDGSADVVFCLEEFLPKDNASIRTEYLMDIHKQIVYRKNLFPEDRQPESLEDFSDQTFIITEDVEHSEKAERAFLQNNMIPFVPDFRYVPDIENLIWAMRSGKGVAVVDSSTIIEDEASALARVTIPAHTSMVMAWLTERENKSIGLFVSKFRHLLQEKEQA